MYNLFIGGWMDGARMTLPENLWEYRSAENEFYERMKIAGDLTIYSVFKLKTMTPDEVIAILIEEYVKK